MKEYLNKFKRMLIWLQQTGRLYYLNRKIESNAVENSQDSPVIFFNASARLAGLNQNAAFSMISSWGVRLAGRQVYHFACQSGMSHCVLGAGLGDPKAKPPCRRCIADTNRFTGAAPTVWFDYQENSDLRKTLDGKSLAELKELQYQDRPLGKLVLPSIRWILRRHHLENNEVTNYLYQEYILSAHNIAENFSEFMAEVNPAAVVVFNGLQFPEATVRWVAKEQGVRVITHEVNLQPLSAFFTDGQATIYPLEIPESFKLSEAQNQALDTYLQKRYRGEFTMAGIKFWSAMDQLPADFISHLDEFRGIVPVFTNVIFDTSQSHANTLFPEMFSWLDLVHETAQKHPEILFVIRAHPDEMRKGKSSQESVVSWSLEREVENLPNLIVVGPDETLSSYELIQRSKFTMVYNSSIGLEATLLGAPVLCAGKARYTQYPIVFYPDSRAEYERLLNSFLTAEEIQIPGQFYENARRFLYYQLFRASLPFDEFLVDAPTPGYVQLKNFSWKKLIPGSTPAVDCIVNGILHGDDFLLKETR
ncbi:MAG: hypothetical protein WBB69_15725 [Anaerolineales bacterium]